MHKLFKNMIVTFCVAFIFTSPVYSEPNNLGLLKNEVKQYHDSGLYQKELTQVIQKAQRFVVAQAKANSHRKVPQKLAIVLDIDETSLSNYNFMIQCNFGCTRKQFHEQTLKADAQTIKPMLALYKEAQLHGIHVFFISGRRQSERQATQENLNKAGFSHWAGLYLRPVHYNQKSVIPFKSHSRKLINQQGYTIIATIGDQYSDLKGGYAEQGFKLPNPYYYLP